MSGERILSATGKPSCAAAAAGLPGRRDRDLAGCVDAGFAQQRLCSRFADLGAREDHGRIDQRRGIGRRGGASGLREACEMGERAHGARGILEDQKAVALKPRQRFGIALADQRYGASGVAGVVQGGADQRAEPGRGGPGGEEGSGHVERPALGHHPERRSDEVRVVHRMRRHIDGVARRAERIGREERGLRAFGQGGDGERMALGGIGHQHACAAGDGDDAEPVALGRRADRGGVDKVEHFLGGPGAGDARAGECRVDACVRARERCGVRLRGARADLRGADLHHRHELAGGARAFERAEKADAVMDGLHVAADRVDAGIGDHVVEDLGE